MKIVGQNDLEELSSLMLDIKNQIRRYSHVSHHLPKKLLSEIDNFDSIILRNFIIENVKVLKILKQTTNNDKAKDKTN